CTFHTCYVSSSPYGYRPSMAANIAFLIIYTACLAGCALVTLATRRWIIFSIPLAGACVLEIVGYSVRMGSWAEPWRASLYAVTNIFLMIAPSLISTAMYTTVPKVVQIIGKEHSLIRPDIYGYLVAIDLVAILVQLVGFIVTFSDLTAVDGLGPSAEKGASVIAAGAGVQFLALASFSVLFTIVIFKASMAYHEFGYTTFHKDRGYVLLGGKFKARVGMMMAATMCLLTRGVFRIMALADGLDGSISRNEALFVVFDGLLVAAAILCLLGLHPAYVL
ncbi:RTA-like protein, partial [Pseudomassariella vexata]